MKEIGKQFGLTSHAVGRALKELGLRDWSGKPSREAFAGGYCAQRWTSDGEHYCWAWHGTKTIEVLQAHGFVRAVEAISGL
jgi:hypothetical protein